MNKLECVIVLVLLAGAFVLFAKGSVLVVLHNPLLLIVVVAGICGGIVTVGRKGAVSDKQPTSVEQNDNYFLKGIGGNGQLVRIDDTHLCLITVQNNSDGEYLRADKMSFVAADKAILDSFEKYMHDVFIPEIDGFNQARLAHTFRRIFGPEAVIEINYLSRFDEILKHFAEYSSYSDISNGK